MKIQGFPSTANSLGDWRVRDISALGTVIRANGTSLKRQESLRSLAPSNLKVGRGDWDRESNRFTHFVRGNSKNSAAASFHTALRFRTEINRLADIIRSRFESVNSKRLKISRLRNLFQRTKDPNSSQIGEFLCSETVLGREGELIGKSCYVSWVRASSDRRVGQPRQKRCPRLFRAKVFSGRRQPNHVDTLVREQRGRSLNRGTQVESDRMPTR